MNKISRTFAVGISAVLLMACSSLYGQTSDNSHLLVGAWEYVGPVTVDCDTREPNGPEIRAALLFNQGGTMFVEDTLPVEGPYRSTGPGIWKRETNGEYSYAHMHYSFAPDNTFLFTVKLRSRLRLSKDGQSFTEKGSFDVITPDGAVIHSGCFEGTTDRVVF